MKRTDVAAIVFIASLSVLVAYFIASTVIGNRFTENEKIKTITPITSEVEKADPTIFNEDAINPTVEVEIGGQTP